MVLWLWALSAVSMGLFTVDVLYWQDNYPEPGTVLSFLADHCQALGPLGLALALFAVAASLPPQRRVFDRALLIATALVQGFEFLQWMLSFGSTWWVIPLGSVIAGWCQGLWLILAIRVPTWPPVRRRWWFLLSTVFFLYGATRVFYQIGSYVGGDEVREIAPLLIVVGLFFLMRRPRGPAT